MRFPWPCLVCPGEAWCPLHCAVSLAPPGAHSDPSPSLLVQVLLLSTQRRSVDRVAPGPWVSQEPGGGSTRESVQKWALRENPSMKAAGAGRVNQPYIPPQRGNWYAEGGCGCRSAVHRWDTTPDTHSSQGRGFLGSGLRGLSLWSAAPRQSCMAEEGCSYHCNQSRPGIGATEAGPVPDLSPRLSLQDPLPSEPCSW